MPGNRLNRPRRRRTPATAAPAGQRAQGGGQRGRGAGRGAARTRKVVLAWADTRNGQAQHDPSSHALAVIERLGYESGAYDTFIRTDSNIICQETVEDDRPARERGPEPEQRGRHLLHGAS